MRLTTAFQSCVWLLPALTFPSRQDSVCLVRFLRIFKIVGVEICVQVGTCSRWSFKWTKIEIAWVFLLFALLLILTVCQVNECFGFMKEHTFGLTHERPCVVHVVHLSLLLMSPPGSVPSSVGLLDVPQACSLCHSPQNLRGHSYRWHVSNTRANSIDACLDFFLIDFFLINTFRLISVQDSKMNLKLKRDSD